MIDINVAHELTKPLSIIPICENVTHYERLN